jgi:hypothetical protein
MALHSWLGKDMRNCRWLYVFVAAILVLIGIRIYIAPYRQLLHQRHEAFDATFRQYSNAVLARDYATAYSFGGREFRIALSEPDFAAEQQSLEDKFGNLESSRSQSLSIEGKTDPGSWSAKVLEVRHYRRGNVRLLYKFLFEDGRWQLFGYQEHE